MNALIAKERYHFHERLFETNTLTLTKAGVASNADTSSRGSKAIAKRVVDILVEEQQHKINIVEKISGQTLGKQFEMLTMEFLQATFPNLQNLYPGKWSILQLGNNNKLKTSDFEQYEHLAYLNALTAENAQLAAALGNDYLVFDPNHNELELDQANVKMICDRNEGLGADGVLEGPILKEDGMHVKVWNPDGSESETSGNGVRIFAKYLKDAGYVQKKNFKLYTGNGPVEVTFLNEDGSRLRVSMGKLSFWSDEIPVIGERREVINEDMVFGRTLYPVTCVSIGNPHCVIPMREISKPLVCKIGDYSEIARYFPNRINTQIMQVIDKENIAIEIFERGAGYTRASGTGACAAAGVAYKLGLTNSKVIVHMPGGELQVEVEDDWNVYMTGDVFYIAKVTLSNEFAERLRAL